MSTASDARQGGRLAFDAIEPGPTPEREGEIDIAVGRVGSPRVAQIHPFDSGGAAAHLPDEIREHGRGDVWQGQTKDVWGGRGGESLTAGDAHRTDIQTRMDWKSLRFDWNNARAFLLTAELGSLAKAATALGLSQPTLSRQVEAMQQSFRVVLFERAGSGLVLTRAGGELLKEVRGMGEAAWRARTAAEGQSQTMTGKLVIAASDVYVTSLLPPVIARIAEAHPALEIEIVAANGRTDLRRREADIAVRSYETEHPEIITKKIGWDAGGFFASRGWVERNGAPVTKADLSHLPLVGYPGQSWMFRCLAEQGFPLCELNLRVVSASHLAQWAHVRAGAGVGLMTLRVGEADPGVCRLLEDEGPLRFPVWLAAHRDLRTSLRVRTVYDMLAEGLSPLLSRT